MSEILNRVRSFFHKREQDTELEAELASHLDLAIEENLQRGMSTDEARRQALVRFGGLAQAKERQREARGLPWLDVLIQDLRYTVRTLRRDRIFTSVAILILGLGIGANIAVFSVVNTLLLRPLPFPNSQQLVRILTGNTTGGESSMTFSTDATEEIQRENRSFQEVTGYFAFSTPDNLKLIGSGQPLPVTGISVAGNVFHTLGIDPAIGRTFTPEECQHNAKPVALLSNAFWKRQYGGSRDIVGKSINLDGQSVTVIGVLPPSFDFGSVFSPGTRVDLYTPAIFEDMRDWGNTMALFGRLKPGVTLQAAQADADILFPRLHFNIKHPEWGGGYTVKMLELKDYVSGKLRQSLIVLWCAVGLILLIVCVNLSNLMLARSASRSKEFAMRTALGASRRRLVRQMLTESLVLASAGAFLGLVIAFAITFYLAHQASLALPLLTTVRIDGAALGWSLLVAVLAAVLFGLAPGLRMSSGHQLQESLKDSGHGANQGRKHERMRSVLVVSEIALAFVLLVGAGLLLRSFLRILDIDLGFEPSRAAAISVDYDDGNDPAKRSAIWQEVIRRAQALPGVETAGITDDLPLSRNRSWGISAKGKTYRKGELEDTFVYIVSPGYLNAIGMHLVRGRDIRWDDGPKSAKVVMINEKVARSLWPGQDPIGRTAILNATEAEVIGVVADVRESSPEGNAGWQMYLPTTQWGAVGANLVVRSKLPPETLAPSVMNVLRQINPAQPAVEFRSLRMLVDHAVSPRRFFVILVAAFATLGLLLASLGIYGVISYSVTRQTQEIGIRMALGATRARVQYGVLTRTLWLAFGGIAVGTIGSLAISSLIASLLYGTAPTDRTTFLSMIVLLAFVALLAGYIPARRASRIDPMIALRSN